VLAERRPEVRLPEPVRTRRLGRPA
jgi:hypothetical protein